MSYHSRMSVASADEATKPSFDEKTLEADEASRLVRLAYRVVLKRNADPKALSHFKSRQAKEVAKAVLGSTSVDHDALEMAEKLKNWVRRNTRISERQPEILGKTTAKGR